MLNYSYCVKTQNEKLISYVEANLELCLVEFSEGGKKETYESILFLLNSEALSEEIKLSYLKDQKVKLCSYGDINDKYWDIATQSFLVTPTWENVFAYREKCNQLNDLLSEYLIRNIEELKSEEFTNTDKDLVHELFQEIAISKNLNDEVVSALLFKFESNLFPEALLQNVDEERLSLLIKHGRIPFTEGFTNKLKARTVFVQYLIKHRDEFFAVVSSAYFEKQATTKGIFESDAFSEKEKTEMLKHIPANQLYSTDEMANFVIKLLTKFEVYDDSLPNVEILKASTLQKEKVLFASKVLEGIENHEKIAEILLLLGSEYDEVSKRDGHPKIADNSVNEQLLEVLVKKEFISSYKRNGKNNKVLWVYFPENK